MIDTQKRNLLKAASVAAISAIAPLSAQAHITNTPHKHTPGFSTNGGIFQDAQLQIEVTSGDQPSMRLTNTGTELVIVRELHPGTVQVMGQTFDLNQAFKGSNYAIGAGRSRTISIRPISSDMATDMSSVRTPKSSFKVVAVTANRARDRLLHASVTLA